MLPKNYVTFKCSKYSTITRGNNYCKEEDMLGNYLADEFNKRGDYVKQTYFTDFGFEIYFKIGNKTIYSLLTVVDDEELKFGLSIKSTLGKIERFFWVNDENEITFVNQILEDILKLDNSISEVTWKTELNDKLNMYEGIR